MDRRAFLQSGTIVAAAGGALANAVAPVAAKTASSGVAGQRDWSRRQPKGAPVIKRFDEQRWVLDNVIQANGVDWDQSHTGVVIRSGGPSTIPDMAELRKRVKRLVDIGPAFESLAKQRETMAHQAEQAGDKAAARENYFLAANYWSSAMWTIDEVNQKLLKLNENKRGNFNKYMAVADHHIEWVELPYRGKTLPAIFHLPPNYQAGAKVPVIVAVSGMDGFKERGLGRSRAYRRRLAHQAAGDRRRQDRHDRRELRLVLHRHHDVGRCALQSLRGGRHLLRAGRRDHLQPGLADVQKALHVHVRHHRRARVRRLPQDHRLERLRAEDQGRLHRRLRRVRSALPAEHTDAFVKALGGPKQLLVYEGGNHSVALTTATVNGPEPRKYQAEWMAARLEGRPFASERWFVGVDGNVVKEALG